MSATSSGDGAKIIVPEFGRQTVHFLPDGVVLVIGISWTVKRAGDESEVEFMRRLAAECTPQDEVEITYQGGLPQYAVIRFAVPRE